MGDDSQVLTLTNCHLVPSTQERLATGEATDDEYRVETAHDIAIKVLSTRYALISCTRSRAASTMIPMQS